MMADSDGENEQFVENVMHELQAFQTKPKTDSEQNRSENEKVGDGANGVGQSDSDGRFEDTGKPSPADGKAPTRIIKLSRPSTQFSSSRARASNLPETNAPAPQSASSNVNGVANTALATAVSGTPAPGSRLAALQRPGSPFHKYLQRAQSPALATAAKLTKPASVPSTNTSAENIETAKDKQSIVETQGINCERNENDSSVSENKSDAVTNQTQSRSSIIPPRIQSSALTSSVLLRRPQSPLHGSRGSHLPVNKQVAGVVSEHSESADPGSPNSPKSPKPDGPASPGISAANNITSADRVAIRNKLRANSFRLKDLLTKRPYGKAKDEDSETKDDSATTATDRLGQLRSTSLDNADGENKTDNSRVSAILLRSRSRASGERPPPTLISARSLRTRSADKPDSEVKFSVVKETNVAESNTCAKNNISEESIRTEKPNTETSNTSSSVVSFDKGQKERNSVLNTSSEENQGISENSVTIGATLIRSPKTRILSTDESPVPSDQIFFPTEHDIPKESHTIPCDAQNIPRDSITDSNIPHHNQKTSAQDQNAVTSHDQNANAKNSYNLNDGYEHKSKAILDLDKEKEANLVFDSETMGQTEQNIVNSDPSQSLNAERMYSNLVNSKSDEIRSDSHKSDLKEIQDARKSAKESFLSQSLTSQSLTSHSSSTPRWRDWKRQRSEPGTTLTDSMKDTDKSDKRHLPVDDSKTSESVAAVDMSRSSPAMKRSLVVTDLDKAMIDRDQQKLSSMFKDGSQGDGEKEEETKTKGK